MEPVATSSSQLTSQVHQLSPASPCSENPSYLALTDHGKTLSASMSVTTDARLAIDPMYPNLLRQISCPASPGAEVQHVSPVNPSVVSSAKLQGALTQSPSLENLPNEVLFHIMGFLDVNDLLSTSRVSIDCPPFTSTYSVPSRYSRRLLDII
jgi:hypothetical protein